MSLLNVARPTSHQPDYERLLHSIVHSEDILAFPLCGTETDTGTDGGGGGGGSVTSVAGGVGITNSPEPIVGAGTVDLDIASLVTIVTPAGGDLLALVDVSAGGSAIAQQRNITFANLTAGLQPLDPDLTAFAALAGTGIAVRTAADTWALRTLVAPAAGITIANPAGVAGNPTFALADDLLALEGMAGTGLVARTAANTYAQRSILAGVGVALTNGGGVAGDPTVDLHINLLTTETTVSSGDLFAFQDVSAGTGVGHQRKATLADIVTGIAALNSNDPFSGYLRLAGRVGSTNDALLSTSGGVGRITGSSSAGGRMELAANSGTPVSGSFVDVLGQLRVGPNASFYPSSFGNYNFVELGVSQTLPSGDLPILRGVRFVSTLTTDAGMTSVQLFQSAPTIVTTAASSTTLGAFQIFLANCTVTPGTGADITGTSFIGLPVGLTLNAGTVACTLPAVVGLNMGGQINNEWDIDDWVAVRMNKPGGSGAARSALRVGAVEVADLADASFTNAYSMWSKGAAVPLCHGGAAIFGVSQAALTVPAATVDVGGDLALRRQDMALANGANNDMTRTGSYIRLTGGGAAPPTLSGLTGGQNGVLVCLFNDTGNNVTIVHNATSVAANQFNTVTAANKTLANQRCMFFFYETAAGKWVEMMPQ